GLRRRLQSRRRRFVDAGRPHARGARRLGAQPPRRWRRTAGAERHRRLLLRLTPRERPASRRTGLTAYRRHDVADSRRVTDPRRHGPTDSRTHGLTHPRPHGLRLPTMSAVAVRPLWIVGAMFVPAR